MNFKQEDELKNTGNGLKRLGVIMLVNFRIKLFFLTNTTARNVVHEYLLLVFITI